MSRHPLRPLRCLLAALVVVGCGGDPPVHEPAAAATTVAADPAGAGPVAPPAWLQVSADYPRYLHHKRRLAVVVTNRGATELLGAH